MGWPDLASDTLYHLQENIKDVIAHVMTTQEAKVKQLSESRFAGPCFKNLHARWEMNIHPEKEEKPPPCVPLESL